MNKYIYDSDIRKILEISYHTQLNNEIDKYITCNTTSLNTVLDFYGLKFKDDEITRFLDSDEARKFAETLKKTLGGWFISLFDRHRQREAWLMIEWAANDIFKDNGIDIKAKFDDNMNIEKVIQNINSGKPVICHLNHKVTGLDFGHYIVAVGYDLSKQCLIFHDPFGNWILDYKGSNGKMGKYVEYPNNLLKKYMSKNRSIRFEVL